MFNVPMCNGQQSQQSNKCEWVAMHSGYLTNFLYKYIFVYKVEQRLIYIHQFGGQDIKNVEGQEPLLHLAKELFAC